MNEIFVYQVCWTKPNTNYHQFGGQGIMTHVNYEEFRVFGTKKEADDFYAKLHEASALIGVGLNLRVNPLKVEPTVALAADESNE